MKRPAQILIAVEIKSIKLPDDSLHFYPEKAGVPYYKEAKFEERIPPFKLTTDALALYWDPYMHGETTQTEALKKVIDHILANEK